MRLRSAVSSLVALVPLALALAAPVAHAAWPHDPSVNVLLAPDGIQPQQLSGKNEAVSDGAGGIVVVWEDQANGAGNIKAQRLDGAGNRLWGTNGVVVCNAGGRQSVPHIVRHGADGRYVVGWIDARSGNADVYVQLLDANGTAQWTANGVAVCTNVAAQSNVRVAWGFTGTVFLAWVDARTDGGDIYWRQVDNGVPAGVADGSPLCSATGTQSQLAVTSLPSMAGFAAAWSDERVPGNADIYTRWADSFSGAQGAVNGDLLCNATAAQVNPVFAPEPPGTTIFVAWEDNRGGSGRVYAQRRNLFGGGVFWTANGVEVNGAAGVQFQPAMTLDGQGGLVVAMTTYPAGFGDIHAQRLSVEDGSRQWGATGRILCDRPETQFFPEIEPDGAGGVYVAWLDQRAGTNDVFAQRVDNSGFTSWLWNGGVPLANGSETANGLSLVARGAEGAIVSFQNTGLNGHVARAQGVDRWGYLGGEPDLVDVSDVPHDQGGRVKVSWDASPIDSDPLFGQVADYVVYRSAPASAAHEIPVEAFAPRALEGGASVAPAWLALPAPDGTTSYWEQVGVQDAMRLPSYSLVLATTGDSTGAGNPATEFLVMARGFSGAFWLSEPLSGYSVDDLAPAAPAPFAGTYASGVASLTWEPNDEPDLAHYHLYRGATGAFTPSPANRIATLTTTTFLDPAGAAFAYRVTAVDTHGNESPSSLAVPGVVDAASDVATVFHLAPVAPNPVRGTTAFARFGLPREGRVSLTLYDARGRVVTTPVDGVLPAGEHRVALAPRGVRLPGGAYFLRLSADGKTATRAITLLD